jgi:hypothetical protein
MLAQSRNVDVGAFLKWVEGVGVLDGDEKWRHRVPP